MLLDHTGCLTLSQTHEYSEKRFKFLLALRLLEASHVPCERFSSLCQ
jgi:hypothetical protein